MSRFQIQPFFTPIQLNLYNAINHGHSIYRIIAITFYIKSRTCGFNFHVLGIYNERIFLIGTDFEKGFIKADIVSYDDFVAAEGSMVKIKEEGKLRQEGRDYVMQDGDIVEFKFNVSKK